MGTRILSDPAEAWPEQTIVQQPVGQLPWGHNIRLLDKLTDPTERLCYAQSVVENGWSRAGLKYQIEGRHYQRQVSSTINFQQT